MRGMRWVRVLRAGCRDAATAKGSARGTQRRALAAAGSGDGDAGASDKNGGESAAWDASYQHRGSFGSSGYARQTPRSYDGSFMPQWLPSDPMFDVKVIKGMSVEELRKMSTVFNFLRPDASRDMVLDDGFRSVRMQENPLFRDELPVSSLPELPAEILKQFRADVTPTMANDNNSAWNAQYVPPADAYGSRTVASGEGGARTSAHDEVDVRAVRLENERWARVDELTGAVTSRKTQNRVPEILKYSPVRSLKQERTRKKLAKQVARRLACPLTDSATGKVMELDFRKVNVWSRFLSETGRIVPRKFTKTRPKAQKKLAKSIKMARTLGLVSRLSYPFGLVDTSIVAPGPRTSVASALEFKRYDSSGAATTPSTRTTTA